MNPHRNNHDTRGVDPADVMPAAFVLGLIGVYFLLMAFAKLFAWATLGA